VDESVFVIAEIGSVHDGSFGNALKLVDLAAGVGADAVKFQMHIAEAETLRDAPMPPYFSGEPRFEYFQRTAFEMEQWADLMAAADGQGLAFLCSAFSVEAVNRLEELQVTAHKVPSGEVTNIPLLKEMGRTGKTVYLSSGMSSWAELDEAVAAVRDAGGDLVMLQCTSAYPCPIEQLGLNVMSEMRARYDAPVGLSDHSLSVHVAPVAVALGATVVEKHLTISTDMYGSDAAHSLSPEQFSRMVDAVREAERLLAAKVDKDEMARNMEEMKRIFEKSIVSVTDIPRGAVITMDMLGLKKPGGGLPPRDLDTVAGQRARVAIPKDTILSLDCLSD